MNFQTKAITLLLLASTTSFAFAQDLCAAGGSVTVISSTAPDSAGLEESFELFRTLLGGDNNANDPAAADGHRQVNWDAPIVPFDMPADFFAATVIG